MKGLRRVEARQEDDSQALVDRLRSYERFARSSRLHHVAKRPIAVSRVWLYRLLPFLRPSEVRVRLFTGQTMTTCLAGQERAWEVLYKYRFWEASLTHMVLSFLRAGMVFVDVGAHHGYYTLLASKVVGPTGRVFAFEPSPRAYSILIKNAASCGNVSTEQLALTSTRGTRTLRDFGAQYDHYNTLLSEPRLPRQLRARLNRAAYQVGTVTLDEYCADHEVRPDFVKIDVESTELEVLQGMARLLRDASPNVSIETGDMGITGAATTAECIRHLEEFGYAGFDWVEGGLVGYKKRETYDAGNLVFTKAGPGTHE